MVYSTVLTQRNFAAEFHRENVSYILVKQPISVSEPPIFGGGGLRGRPNVCDSYLTRWKARSRLSVGYN